MIRVDVATHFNEDSFSYGLAQGMADRLRAALRGVNCADHEGQTTVRVSTQGVAQVPNDLIVEVKGCCDAVSAHVAEVIAEVRSGA